MSGGSQTGAGGAGGSAQGTLGSLLSEFHLGPLLPLHFCLLEAAGPQSHCAGRLKGFGGPEEQRPATWLCSVCIEGPRQTEGAGQALPLR